MMNMTHPYHLVNLSPWPLISIYSVLFLTVSLVNWFHYMSALFVLISVIAVLLYMLQWWRDVIREGTLQGLHTKKVQTGLKWDMILFITSEMMFFFSFFKAFFHSSLSPSLELSLVWPPGGGVSFEFRSSTFA